jgi:hypothetical protein
VTLRDGISLCMSNCKEFEMPLSVLIAAVIFALVQNCLHVLFVICHCCTGGNKGIVIS